MRQFIYRIIVLLSMCFSSLSFASSTHYYPVNSKQTPRISSATQSLGYFTNLQVTGNTDVVIRMGGYPSMNVLNANAQNQVISLGYKGQTLLINSSPMNFAQARSKQVRPLIQITVPQINFINAQDNATVSGNVMSNNLNVVGEGRSQIYLTGMMNIQNIQSSNRSQIKLRWVNSQNLVLASAGNSKVQLAGVTQVLHASLSDNAQLDGQYLRARRAIIQADNQAFAGITAVEALRSFASNDSNIFYYKYPRNFSEFSLESGNILQVDWRP